MINIFLYNLRVKKEIRKDLKNILSEMRINL